MKPVAIYDNIEAYYAERGDHPETDCGGYNTDDLETEYAGINPYNHPYIRTRMRVSVSEVSGDVYAVYPQADSPEMLLGTIRLDPDEDPYRQIDRAFAGYADGPGLGKPLSWYMLRIAELKDRT